MQFSSLFTHTNLSLLNLADEDECTADTTLCANGVCNNLDGMPYTCTCDSGYVDDGSGQACVGKNCQVLLHEFPKTIKKKNEEIEEDSEKEVLSTVFVLKI